jgi:hypothetical protein
LGAYTGPEALFPTEFTLFNQVLERDFPHLAEESAESERVTAEETELYHNHFDSSFTAYTRGLKRIISPARLVCGRRGSQESQGNITSPR